MSKLIEDRIFDFIKENKTVRTKDLETALNLTQSSTRRHLIKLEQKGLIKRLFGEIILNEEKNFIDIDFNERINSNCETKKKIAKHASKLARGYTTIFLDSGSLCYFLLDYLDREVEIFTNSLSNATRAIELNFRDVHILGGTIKPKTSSIVDFDLDELAKNNFPIAFLGVNAIDEDGNLYTPEKRESKSKNDIINHSQMSIVLAESEKFNTKSTFNFNPKRKNVLIVTNAQQKLSEKSKNLQIIVTKE